MQTCRLYATKHLRVLLRAGVEFFSSWGMELLVTQLHDHSKTVSMEALDILDEACEDKVTQYNRTEEINSSAIRAVKITQTDVFACGSCFLTYVMLLHRPIFTL